MDELTLRRLARRSEETEEMESRLLMLAARQKLYRQAHGRDAPTAEVLDAWASQELRGRDLDPYAVLDRAEIAQLWEDVDDSTESYV